jgi:hypothetical protein
MLDFHPEVAFIEEFEYVTDLVGPDGTYPDLDTYGRFLETNRVFQTSGFSFRQDRGYRELVDGFLRQRQAKAGTPVVGATLHFGFSKALELWPGAKLIHLIRDPRDVAPSVIKMGWAGNTWRALDKWLEAEDEWDRVAPMLGPDRKLSVRYADLVSDHEAVLTDICDFMGVEYSERMLDYAAKTDYDLPDPSAATRWPQTLSKREIQLAEARIGLDRLRAKGFEPSGLRTIEVGARHRLWLEWHDRACRLRARTEQNGLRHTVEDLLARAIGSERWTRSLRLQAMEHQKARLKKSWVDPEDEVDPTDAQGETDIEPGAGTASGEAEIEDRLHT